MAARLLIAAAALVACDATERKQHGRALRPSRSPKPPPPPAKPNQGEIWSAFFAYNLTANGDCQSPLPPTETASFYVARYKPTGAAWDYYISQPYGWSSIQPIYAKALTFGGSRMAVDSVNRIGYALMSTTTWTAQSYVMSISFPANAPNSSRVLGVCQMPPALGNPYTIGQIYYSARLGGGAGPWFWWPSNGLAPSIVTTISVPPLPYKPKPGAPIPNCTLTNVSSITDPSFQLSRIPPPLIGTDRKGGPLGIVLNTNPNNASQIQALAYSLVTGRQAYNGTWACGYPSYLYQCPPTTGANWPQQGLFGPQLSNGTLLIGGGDWSDQQYFQALLPALAEEEEEEAEEHEGVEEGVEVEEEVETQWHARGSSDATAAGTASLGDIPIPTLAYVNTSSNQGTWFAGPVTNLWVQAAGQWPVSVSYTSGTPSSCAQPSYYGNIVLMGITDPSGNTITQPYAGSYLSGACPLRQQDFPGWWSTAACSGAAVGYPDPILAPATQ